MARRPVIGLPHLAKTLPTRRALPSMMDDDLSFPGQEIDYDDSHAPENPLAKKKPKSGGFQSMGLSSAVYKSVMRKGYKVPPATYCRAPRPRPAARLPPPPTAATFASLTAPACLPACLLDRCRRRSSARRSRSSPRGRTWWRWRARAPARPPPSCCRSSRSSRSTPTRSACAR